MTIGTNRSEFTYDGLSQRVRIVERTNGVIASEKRFLWSDTEICEERNASGETVSKRFFARGIQEAGTNYFCTRDHLGSVREMTDATATVRARYEFDSYARRTRISGDLEADFGFTGYYFHVPSSLQLALYRAYDADSGRWLNRDPIGERGGINLYAYVGNDPVNWIDPFGLRPLTDCEKQALAPYIPEVDLDNADLRDGKVPWYLGKKFDGITRGNRIYFRAGVYDPSSPDGLAVLGHELVHVGQYRNGMNIFKYLWASRRGYDKNPYEKPAYDKEAEIKGKLDKDKCCPK